MAVTIVGTTVTQTASTTDIINNAFTNTIFTKTTVGRHSSFVPTQDYLFVINGLFQVQADEAHIIGNSSFDLRPGGHLYITSNSENNRVYAGGKGLILNTARNNSILFSNATNTTNPAMLTVENASIELNSAAWQCIFHTDALADINVRIRTRGKFVFLKKGTTADRRIRTVLQNTGIIDFQAEKTYCGFWLNFGCPQISLKGLTPVGCDGPEINIDALTTANLVILEDYDDTFVTPTFYANARLVLFGAPYVRLENNLNTTNMQIVINRGSNAGGSANTVLEISKRIKYTLKGTDGFPIQNFRCGYITSNNSVNAATLKGGGTAPSIPARQVQSVLTDAQGTNDHSFVFARYQSSTASGGTASVLTYTRFNTGEQTAGAETQAVTCRKYDRKTVNATLNLFGNGQAVVEDSSAIDEGVTDTEENALLLWATTGTARKFTIIKNATGTTVNIVANQSFNYNEYYDAYKSYFVSETNFDVVAELSVSGTTIVQPTAITLTIANGITITGTSKFQTIEFKTEPIFSTNTSVLTKNNSVDLQAYIKTPTLDSFGIKLDIDGGTSKLVIHNTLSGHVEIFNRLNTTAKTYYILKPKTATIHTHYLHTDYTDIAVGFTDAQTSGVTQQLSPNIIQGVVALTPLQKTNALTNIQEVALNSVDHIKITGDIIDAQLVYFLNDHVIRYTNKFLYSDYYTITGSALELKLKIDPSSTGNITINSHSIIDLPSDTNKTTLPIFSIPVRISGEIRKKVTTNKTCNILITGTGLDLFSTDVNEVNFFQSENDAFDVAAVGISVEPLFAKNISLSSISFTMLDNSTLVNSNNIPATPKPIVNNFNDKNKTGYTYSNNILEIRLADGAYKEANLWYLLGQIRASKEFAQLLLDTENATAMTIATDVTIVNTDKIRMRPHERIVIGTEAQVVLNTKISDGGTATFFTLFNKNSNLDSIAQSYDQTVITLGNSSLSSTMDNLSVRQLEIKTTVEDIKKDTGLIPASL